ncbi:GcrA cell cycle regulator [Komagataeibacter melaceti]|uniref:GcrA cell cycle regulator n=1 Tax=Komagataeibacter melaceti TaxID=2766577 RepID=A0A371Z125_9PROT|nr:GcrA family cell cycle regulator [Komagataeibacter melaceti]RFD20089.1 GcrA cell cycle regulator [Komagataeibacter melaceti]
MAMEWTEETIARLRDLWQQGLSTAEIGRQLSVTKNAVVGKAHRLGLKPRPSPIRRAKAAAPAEPAAQAAPATTSPETAAPAVAEPPVAQAVPAAAPIATPEPEAPPAPATAVTEAKPEPAAPPAAESEPAPAPRATRAQPRATRAALRPVSEPRRRSSQSCCWPLGDPGTPGFHFCGATPLPGKPYCAEHAQLAYVKLRDRRDNVA